MIDGPDESGASERHFRRAEAAKYVVETYNGPCSYKTLGEAPCVSSKRPAPRFGSRDVSRYCSKMPGLAWGNGAGSF